MAERPRSPQDKKGFSRERDRRNVYGENDKVSRKAIPRFKRQSVRTERRGVSGLFASLEGCSAAAADMILDDLDPRVAEETFKGSHPEKAKVPDLSLGLIRDAEAVKDKGASDDDRPLRRRRDAVRREMTLYEHPERRKKPQGISK